MKLKPIVVIFLILAVLGLTFPRSTQAFNLFGHDVDFIGTFNSVFKAVRLVKGAPGYIPHTFPFGGRITSSERGCAIRFWIWQIVCVFGICVPVPCPDCGYIPIPGRTITVGNPVPVSPSPGKIFTFPFISDVYRNHEARDLRAGPWSLGLGFTPFPLKQINKALAEIPNIPIPNGWLSRFKMVCKASGEKDRNGDDIYKVIRKLGTSRE